MENTSPPSDYIAASEIAKKHKTSLLDMVLLSAFLLEECEESAISKVTLSYAKKAIRLGVKALATNRKTVSFSVAVEATLLYKSHRRERTLQEITYFTQKLMSQIEGLGKRSVREIDSEEWKEYLDKVFTTLRQKYKARVILHGIFSLMCRRGYCDKNPMVDVEFSPLQEKRIKALTLQESAKLLDCAREENQGECLVPIALMLYAGIRPYEIQRLSWGNVVLEKGVIALNPQQTKTGGVRYVTIEPALLQILEEEISRLKPEKKTPICPRNWVQKWSAIRQKAGWSHSAEEGSSKVWQQDCLRHTYASFHALHYKDFSRLQYEMGHSSSQLLRTRYLNMEGICPQEALIFWGKSTLC